MKRYNFFVIFLIFLPFISISEEIKKDIVFNLGLSYIGTTGNTDTMTFGTDFSFKKNPNPWGFEGLLGYIRGEQMEKLTAERIKGLIKGSRSLSSKMDYFIAGEWEKDKFSGFNSRSILSTGLTFKAISNQKDELLVDTGFTFTDEDYVSGEDDSYFGGIIGIKYLHNWTEKSKFQEKILWYPNFEESSKWHGESETSVISALSDKFSLKGSFLLRYNNKPIEGFEKKDTITSLSLIYSF